MPGKSASLAEALQAHPMGYMFVVLTCCWTNDVLGFLSPTRDKLGRLTVCRSARMATPLLRTGCLLVACASTPASTSQPGSLANHAADLASRASQEVSQCRDVSRLMSAAMMLVMLPPHDGSLPFHQTLFLLLKSKFPKVSNHQNLNLHSIDTCWNGVPYLM